MRTEAQSGGFTAQDRRHLAAALSLARRGLGTVWPNPSVGCVVTDADGFIAGRGWTQPGGRPHAETIALERAGERARGGTAYVTLEPCNHHGKTPPCTEALIEAGIARIVAPCEDPDSRVSGSGFARLRAAGIAVETGLMAEEARALNAGFFSRIHDGRPRVALKLATSRDGRIALASGESKWITGEAARRRGHVLRAENDAVLVGIGTALADDPELTVRLPRYAKRQPLRVVLDSAARLPAGAKLRRGRAGVLETLQIVGAPARETALSWLHEGDGVSVETAKLDPETRRVEPAAVLARLAERGVTRLLIEGGGTVAAAFLAAGLVDELHHFQAGMMIGGDGRAAVAGLHLDRLGAAQRFRLATLEPVGGDTYALLTAER